MFKARLSLFIGILCISLFPVLIRLQLNTGLISAFYRMFFSALIMIVFCVVFKKFETKNKRLLLLAAVCGILFASDVAVWNIAIQGSSAAQASLLTNLSPIWIGLASLFFFKKKLKLNFWIGCALALTGMIVFIGKETLINLKFDVPFLFGILSGLFYSTYLLISKEVLKEMSVPNFMGVQLIAASIFLGIVCFAAGEAFSGFSSQAWLVLLVQAVVCQLLAWNLLSFATTKMQPTRISIALLSQAFIAALLAWFFIDEKIEMRMIVGGVIMIAGIAITFLNANKEVRMLKEDRPMKIDFSDVNAQENDAEDEFNKS